MIIIRVFMSINGYDISEIYSFPWVELICFTKAILITNPRSVKASIFRALTDVHIQDWGQKMNSSSKGKSYNYLKQDLNFENYPINLDKNITYLLLNSDLSRRVAVKIYL